MIVLGRVIGQETYEEIIQRDPSKDIYKEFIANNNRIAMVITLARPDDDSSSQPSFELYRPEPPRRNINYAYATPVDFYPSGRIIPTGGGSYTAPNLPSAREQHEERLAERLGN